MNKKADFALARKLKSNDGATLGEVFSFLSGLYFRGKLTYARAFARPPQKTSTGIWVITAGRGLVLPDTTISLGDLLEFAAVPIDTAEPRYRDPLARDAAALAKQLSPTGQAVLLGSIATGKYVDILHEAFGERLVFPQAFVGRGDMSRGGLMLRHVDEGIELDYRPIHGAIRRGPRPAKLPRRKTASATMTE
jgi:hypothetical protein